MRLPVPHQQQQQPGECLAACAAMVLRYLQLPVSYERLKQQLDVEQSGAPFFYIERLRSWRLTVTRSQGTLATIQAQLTAGLPLLVPVDTALLPYWMTRPDVSDAERATDHAVVITGIDEELIYLNDPDFPTAPQTVAHDWFLEAWHHHAHWYALLQRRWPRR